MMGTMTFKVYIKWPGGRTTAKTTTESRRVADFAFRELVAREDLKTQGALGITLTEDSKSIDYHELNDS